MYSFAGLLLLISGHGTKITQIETFGPLLLVIGIFGTTLSITDPVGNITQYFLKRSVKKKYMDIYSQDYYKRKAIKTSWMNYEINKFVSIIYFAILLSTLVYFAINQIFNDVLCKMIVNNSNGTKGVVTIAENQSELSKCKANSWWLITLLIVADAGVLILAGLTYQRLFERREIVANYFELLRQQKHYGAEFTRQYGIFPNPNRFESGESSLSDAVKQVESSPSDAVKQVESSPSDAVKQVESSNNEENTHSLSEQEYENFKGEVKEILDYLEKKDWAMARVLIDGIKGQRIEFSEDKDKDDKPLDGSYRYVIHFGKDDLPLEWSLNSYKYIFKYKNRYFRKHFASLENIADLEYNRDNSLDIYIEQPPLGYLNRNKLAAPKGRFIIALRFYVPPNETYVGQYHLPKAQLIEPNKSR